LNPCLESVKLKEIVKRRIDGHLGGLAPDLAINTCTFDDDYIRWNIVYITANDDSGDLTTTFVRI